MSPDKPKRLGLIWTVKAQADVRAIDQEMAMGILKCLDRYLKNPEEGNVKKMKPPRTDLRLRCGDYRLFFDFISADTIRVNTVRNRREAYR